MFNQYLKSPLASLVNMKTHMSPAMKINNHDEFTIINNAVAKVFIRTWVKVIANIAKNVNILEVGSFRI